MAVLGERRTSKWMQRLATGLFLLSLFISQDGRADDSLISNILKGPSSSQSEAFRLRGRIDTDFLWSDQSPANKETFGDLPDTVGFRRARIGAFGELESGWRYQVEIDLASGDVVLRDGYVAYGDMKDSGEFKFGHMREPFSLEGQTSANSFAFMERSSINQLDPSRNWGVLYHRCNSAETLTFAGGFFQAGTDPSDFQFQRGSTTAMTARVTGLPWFEELDYQLIHWGVAISERVPDEGVITVGQKPNSPLLELGDSSDSSFVRKLSIPANFEQLVNLEFAAASGPLWFEAEWYASIIDAIDHPAVFLHGCHADMGYFLTGEHRQYMKTSGFFGPVSVHRPVIAYFSSKKEPETLGIGAWEITARYSYLNYADGTAFLNTPGNSPAVILPQLTVGLNWYLADRMRLMFNYVHSEPAPVGASPSTADVIGMRLGVFW